VTRGSTHDISAEFVMAGEIVRASGHKTIKERSIVPSVPNQYHVNGEGISVHRVFVALIGHLQSETYKVTGMAFPRRRHVQLRTVLLRRWPHLRCVRPASMMLAGYGEVGHGQGPGRSGC
jgi:hypothetical protein